MTSAIGLVRHGHRARRLMFAALISTMAVVNGCAGDDDSAALRGASDSTTSIADPRAPNTPAPLDSAQSLNGTSAGDNAGLAAATTSPTSGGSDRAGGTTLLSVRTPPPSDAAEESVIFEFDGDSVPRYEIAYAEPPFTRCGSGRPVSVSGAAVLRLRLRSTRAYAATDSGMVPTVIDRDRELDQPLLRQITLTCDFEAEVEWLLGVSARRPYRVLELRSPARLVVELSSVQS